MDATYLLHLFGSAAMIAVQVAAPLLITGLVVGLLVSLFQALTQINESSLSFLPKVAAMGLVLWFALPWVIQQMVGFTVHIFGMVAEAGQ